MESVEEEAVVSELKRQLEDEDMNPEQKVSLLNNGLNKVVNLATVHTDSSVLTRVKSQLYRSGVLNHCIVVLSLDPRRLQGNWSAAAMLAQLTSSCCVGVEPGKNADAFHSLFLPSVMDGLLSLACHLMRRAECGSLFTKVMDSIGWLLRGYTQLTTKVLSSVHYERIQMCDDATVSLLCVQLWIQTCTSSRNFVSGLSDDSVLLLLNEAICQLAVSSDSAVGRASVKLILLMATQQGFRVHPLLLSFRGLDSLLHKDWRGRGFDQDVDQLITFIQSYKGTRSHSQASPEHEWAACTIQAAWRSYKTRRRVKSLRRAVSTLQRRYRARRRQQQKQKEAQQWEEELKYQVCVRRQQARREFHQKQRQLLQLLPPDQVQSFLQECERRAAVVIQSFWRGFRERRRYNNTHRHTLRHTHMQQQAARTLQRAVRHFLQKRRTAKAQPIKPMWIGQNGLTDSRRVELKRQVEEYIALHPSSRVSREECERLHEEVQLLLLSELQRGDQQRREEERMEALLAHTHTQLELLRDAPPLSAVTASDAESFLSPSAPIAARARDAHNAMLQANRLPWWRTLGEADGVDTFSTTQLEELEMELGGLFVGGSAGISKLTENQRGSMVKTPTDRCVKQRVNSYLQVTGTKMSGTLPRFPTMPALLNPLPRSINPPSLPRGITMPSLPTLPGLPSMPRGVNIPSLPRGMSLPRSIATSTVAQAPRRLLQDCCSVLDHQTPGGLCGCCWALRPRYKRLVDNIFPEDPEDGLVKANMEKLTFFALSAPEKLDRIAAYLSERLTRELNRHHYGYVCIAMEAMEQLLLACHCQSINLLVESFLSTLRLLLEADKPQLHILATNSFVKFANIEEDTPSYHRSYDFFVSRFSEMCHSDHQDLDIQNKIRVSGIRGLQGVVRKTVDDELQANIWEPRHMEQIVPALLVNLQYHTHTNSESPAEQTEVCFRELLGRAAYGHINNAIRPVLMHLDSHSLWEGRSFAVQCFKIVMFSIQSQHSHLVIQQLLGHLDANSRSPASVRAGIVEVLSEAAVIEATGSVGPTVLEVFNTLLRQLRQSVDYQLTGYYDNAGKHKTTSTEEKTLQDAVIKTIGSFANTLPIYQRSEVMLFIMGKIPVPGIYPALGSPNAGFEGSRMIQVMLLKSLFQVSECYESSNLLTALPSSFLEPLLSFTLMEDPEVRLLVLSILTSLIDRCRNAARLNAGSVDCDVSVLELKEDRCSRQDNLFIRKHAQCLYRHIYLTCKEESSGRGHYQALITLLAVLSVELANEEVVVDLIRLVLALQELALSNHECLSAFNRCGVHAVCATFLNLLAQLGPPPTLHQHVTQVIESRQKIAPYLLPEDILCDKPRLPEGELQVDAACLFDQSKMCEALTGSSYSAHAERFNTPYTPQPTDEDRLSKRKSVGDVISLQIDIDPECCPDTKQRPQTEEITFQTLKNAIEGRGSVKEEERRRRMQVVERFQTAPFEEIAAHCGARTSLLQSKLDQVFDLIVRPPPSPSGHSPPRSTPLHEMKFPDLCVY